MDKIVSLTKYNRKQHKQFYFFHLFHRGKTVKMLGVIAVVMFFLAMMNTFQKEPNIGTIIFSWIMFGLVLAMAPFLMISRVNNVVKQETTERKQATEKVEVTKIKFTRTYDTLSGKGVLTWTDIDIICETDLYYYIYLSDTNGLFIVKADIIEGSTQLFEKLAMANLRKDKKGRPFYKRYGQVKKRYKAEMKLKKLEMKGK